MSDTGLVLFAVGVVGLIGISAVLVLLVFMDAIRQRDWATVLFMVTMFGLTGAAIVGSFLLYGSPV